MRNANKCIWGILVFTLVFGMILISCGGSGDPSSPSDTTKPIITNTDEPSKGARSIKPVAASNDPYKPVILDLFTEGDRNWYIIDAGYINDTLVTQMGPVHFRGSGEVNFSRTESVESSISRSSTETVSNSIVVSDGTSNTVGIEEGIKVGLNVSSGGDIFKVEGSFEKSITNKYEWTRTLETATGKSRETSDSYIASLTQATSNSTGFSINREDPPGYYRFAFYTTFDVYFIISTSLDNQDLLSWDVISCARSGPPMADLEYLPEESQGRFDNSPSGNLIVFAKGFHKTLEKPPDTSYRLMTSVNIKDSGTVERTPDGNISPTSDAVRYDAGTQVTLQAIPKPGYEFVNWTGTGVPMGTEANNAGITVTMNSDLTLVANFRIMHILTTEVNISSYGTITRSPDQVAYAPGTKVTVTAKPNAGYVFVEWVGAPTGVNSKSASISLTINSDLSLKANFRSLEPRQISEVFNINESWFLPNEVKYPATIEIYALGAGGGGQGGHYSWRVFGENRRGTGGAGGGGAATYIKFTTEQRLQFSVTVGKGGDYGNAKDSDLATWSAGGSGKPGGATTVSWGTNSITAAGGNGGGGSGNRDLNGGKGGSANTVWPASRLDQLSIAGGSGTSGNEWGDDPSRGGNAAVINKGTINTFGGGGGAIRSGGVWARPVDGGTGGGGSGAYGGEGSDNHGGKGGNGQVVIVVKWDE